MFAIVVSLDVLPWDSFGVEELTDVLDNYRTT